MPHILLFAPCQKVIIDQIDTSISLISIISGVVVNMPPHDEANPLPENIAVPMQWAAVSVWLRLAEDENRLFEQQVNILGPGRHIFQSDAVVQFSMTERTHQIYVAASAFPFREAGEYALILSIRERDQNQEWRQVAEYPIEMRHNVQEAPNAPNQPE